MGDISLRNLTEEGLSTTPEFQRTLIANLDFPRLPQPTLEYLKETVTRSVPTEINLRYYFWLLNDALEQMKVSGTDEQPSPKTPTAKADYQNGLLLIKAAILLSPENVLAYMVGAEASFIRNDFGTAAIMTARLLEILPESPKNYKWNYIHAYSLDYTGKSAEALPYFDFCLKLDPDSFALIRGKATALIHINRFDEAIQLCQSIVPRLQGEQKAFANYLIGHAYFHKKDFDEAKRFLELCVKINPEFSSARHDLSEIYICERQFSKALDQIYANLAINPTMMEAHMQKAYIHLLQGDESAAVALFRIHVAHREIPKEEAIAAILAGRKDPVFE